MSRFRRMKTLQKFASVYASMHNHFNQERHLASSAARPRWPSGRASWPDECPPLPQVVSIGDKFRLNDSTRWHSNLAGCGR